MERDPEGEDNVGRVLLATPFRAVGGGIEDLLEVHRGAVGRGAQVFKSHARDTNLDFIGLVGKEGFDHLASPVIVDQRIR